MTFYSLEDKIRNVAIISRLGIIFIQFLANSIIPDHDARVFLKPLNQSMKTTRLDDFISATLEGLTRWDAQYFLHVAHYGYTYENTLAFFPLFPLIIRQLSYFLMFTINKCWNFLVSADNIISQHSALVLVSVIMNNFLFVKTAIILYKLSCLVLECQKLAFISAVLFSFNPASIFFSAIYSESLYCFLTFYGMYLLEKKNSFLYYIILGMASASRSNGLTNLGFIAYKYLKLNVTTKMPMWCNLFFLLGIMLSAFPFVVYQFYCYVKFCFPSKTVLPKFIYDYGVSNSFVFAGNSTVWCENFPPLAYAYVQKHYWNVNFLNYYEIKQIPNFLLASPMVYILVREIFEFVRHYKISLLYLGFYKNQNEEKTLPLTTFPYAVHGFALTVFAVLTIHVQVTTRLLASSSPLLYWCCSRTLSPFVKDPVEGNILRKLKKKENVGKCYRESQENKKSWWKNFLWTESFSGYSFFIKWYFLSYFFVGTVMFSNFLPWT